MNSATENSTTVTCRETRTGLENLPNLNLSLDMNVMIRVFNDDDCGHHRFPHIFVNDLTREYGILEE